MDCIVIVLYLVCETGHFLIMVDFCFIPSYLRFEKVD